MLTWLAAAAVVGGIGLVRHAESRRIIQHRRRAKERQLPSDFTLEDWSRCLAYWSHRCCICGREDGLWCIIAQEHWIAVADERDDNPGTVPWNILPMCHSREGSNGQGSCNQSKWKHDAEAWLIDYLGPRKAKAKLREIRAYFEWVKQQTR